MKADNPRLTEALALWSKYRHVVFELRERGYIRSYKDPKADFSEWIVKTILGGELAQNKSGRGFDILIGDTMRIQVKGLAKDPTNPNGYIVRQKNLENDPRTGATHWAFVIYVALIPKEIFLVPDEFIKRFRVKQQIKREDLIASDCAEKIDI